MPSFLVRDDAAALGFRAHAGPLARTREESYVPWALASDGRVVYAPADQYRNAPSRGGLRPYTSLISQERRKLAQTALGSLALTNLAWTQAAMREVSKGVKLYLTRSLFKNPGVREAYQAKVGKYMYGTGYMSFGRFSDTVPTGPKAAETIWLQALDTLDSGAPLASVLSIHDGVGKMLQDGDSPKTAYDLRLGQLRPALPGELFDPAARGRENNPKGSYTATQVAGIAPAEHAGQFPALQTRNRGVDMYRRTVPQHSAQTPIPNTVSRPELSGVSYYRDLDTRNELFGAGPSGTTGTLLAAGWAFGGLTGELQRQYILAIIGYLVGGGMHSLHESLSVVRLLGPAYQYNSGSMLGYSGASGPGQRANADSLPALPASFLASAQFAQWRDEYHDIVVLGGIHWMFNSR